MGEIKTKTELCISELENQIKSNRSLIYVTTHEEHRVDDAIQYIACQRSKPWSFIFWDIAAGGYTNSSNFKIPENIDQSDILSWFNELIIEKDDFCILVLHDFCKFLSPNSEPGQIEIITIRALRNLIETCNTQRKCVILTGAKYFVPTEFEKLVCLLDWPLPEEKIIKEIVLNALGEISKKSQLKSFKTKYTDYELNQIVQSFRGLTLREIEMILTYFILTEIELDHQKIASKKKDIIKKSGILEWIDLELNLSEIGGLPNLKDWLLKRKEAFSDSAKKYGLPEPKGLLITGIQGGGKCFKKGTQVIMYDGSIKNVEDVIVNDLLMGPDSNPRKVTELSSGFKELYKIIPAEGNSFSVTGNHILNLEYTGKTKNNTIINITVEEYIKKNNFFKQRTFLRKVKIDFKAQEIKIDPYFLGCWIGDETSKDTTIVSSNIEMFNYYNLINNKHIPREYLINKESIRLKLLGGLIDTSGLMYHKFYRITQKNKQLADDILFLVQSLGFSAVQKKKINKRNEIYYIINISGDINKIPSNIIQNQKYFNTQSTNVLTGFKIEIDKPGDFYGFEVDNDHLFLLNDFTIVHNSRSSKAIAAYWGLPLLRLDVGRIFSSLVGSSEENLRSIIKISESIAPCVLWADELEKGFSGNVMSTDSGTSSRVFGAFLTWMAEKKSPVFVVATANDISNLPPELIRKGRFDEIFFVDLPDKDERKEIWTIHLNQRNLIQDFDLDMLVNESEGFTGAEIEAAIIAAMYEGFSDNKREINTVDILKELRQSIPISITMRERIDSLRNWAEQRARNASKTKNFIAPKNIIEKSYKKINNLEEEL